MTTLDDCTDLFPVMHFRGGDLDVSKTTLPRKPGPAGG